MLEVALYNPRQHKQIRCESGAIVFTRANDEPALWTTALHGTDGSNAVIEIAPQNDGVSLKVDGCEALGFDRPGSCQLQVPASFVVGDTRFEINISDRKARHRPLQMLRNDKHDLRSRDSARAAPSAGPSPATLSRWFAALSSLNHWATSLQELYVQAARCAVEAIGLDGGIVFRRREDEWEIAASHLPHPELGIHCRSSALDELLESPRTLFHGGSAKRDSDSSFEPAIVVSPLRNASGELAGAVYGYRSVRVGNARRTIRYLEAHMIELLAGAVSEGIARIEREAETNRRRVLLEQAAAVSHNQQSHQISTEEREITLLFADLRDSTALSETLEPNETYELLSQVMECLTAAVIDHDGLIVDYYGDGLAAMWNAPAAQSDHAELASRAALRMLQTLPGVSADWAELVNRELQLGIGLHTGLAHVGNTGTRRRTKYGPRGTNVNLTSRVEAATRQLSLPLLATEATAKRLSNRFAVHRVCRARMPGVDRPIELYSIGSLHDELRSHTEWPAYDKALQSFECGRLNEAVEILATMDANVCKIPSSFLREHIQREISRQNRRRSTDHASDGSRGVIKLDTK